MIKTVKKGSLVFLENAVRNLPQQYIFWKDINSVYIGCNDSYAKLLGLNSPDDIVGKSDLDIGWLPDGDSAELFRQGDLETMAGKSIINQEEWLSLPNGKKVLVLVNKGPIYDDNNNLLGILGIATDITEKKRIEAELQETHHKLDGMTSVSASLAHELRTPLATLSGGLDGLREYLPNLLDAYQLAKQANLPVSHIRPRNFQLLENLLDTMQSVVRAAFTFIDIQLMNVNPSMEQNIGNLFSITNCVEDALAQYPFQQGEKQLILWNKTDDFVVKGKAVLVKHVLFNLIKNALYYIAKAQKGNISIWLERGSTYNRLYFKDTGPGIAKEILPHIFERFFTRTYHGAGIGLTFCKAVMESLGGKITCESEEGAYTQFILIFPFISE